MSTPPFGILLFVMKGVVPESIGMGEIIRAAIPFLLCDLIVMILLIAFPFLVLVLPALMLVNPCNVARIRRKLPFVYKPSRNNLWQDYSWLIQP
jgi:hypothetical protein